ncbi:hypothetical protein OESDEN_10485, partial [Oesophagostomum dentatum]
MSESDDSAASFFEEPIFIGEHGANEPETQALDFDDEHENVEQEGGDSPFLEQLPPTPPPGPAQLVEAQQPAPPTTPKKIAQFASKMGMISESGTSVCRVRLATNVHTRQINPQLDERQWNAYEAARIEGKSCLNHTREDLVLKQTFAQEWPGVRAFLDSCPKPACLVAHNGVNFDYRVLYGELSRCGFIEKDMGIPDEVVFVDSFLAIKDIEETHRDELHHATKLVDWKMCKLTIIVSEQVSLSRVPACEDIPTAVEEEKVSTQEVTEEMNVTLNLAAQLPNDPRTPNRPPPQRSSHSEPAKLSGRRRLFDEELQQNDHPLLFLNAEDWSPAKRRRIRPEFFRRQMGGRWDFNRTVAQMSTKNKLTTIYET